MQLSRLGITAGCLNSACIWAGVLVAPKPLEHTVWGPRRPQISWTREGDNILNEYIPSLRQKIARYLRCRHAGLDCHGPSHNVDYGRGALPLHGEPNVTKVTGLPPAPGQIHHQTCSMKGGLRDRHTNFLPSAQSPVHICIKKAPGRCPRGRS